MIKFAKVVIGMMSVECWLVAIAYLYSGNFKLASYWALIGGVNAVAYSL